MRSNAEEVGSRAGLVRPASILTVRVVGMLWAPSLWHKQVKPRRIRHFVSAYMTCPPFWVSGPSVVRLILSPSVVLAVRPAAAAASANARQ